MRAGAIHPFGPRGNRALQEPSAARRFARFASSFKPLRGWIPFLKKGLETALNIVLRHFLCVLDGKWMRKGWKRETLSWTGLRRSGLRPSQRTPFV